MTFLGNLRSKVESLAPTTPGNFAATFLVKPGDVLVQTMLEIQLLSKRVVEGRGCVTVWYKVMVGSSCCISECS
jgi:hypothetical protein